MRWRLQLAAQALTTTPRGVADIAAEVGYESEAAFNRAFKRLFGTPPHGIGGSTEPRKRLRLPKRRCSSRVAESGIRQGRPNSPVSSSPW